MHGIIHSHVLRKWLGLIADIDTKVMIRKLDIWPFMETLGEKANTEITVTELYLLAVSPRMLLIQDVK